MTFFKLLVNNMISGQTTGKFILTTPKINIGVNSHIHTSHFSVVHVSHTFCIPAPNTRHRVKYPQQLEDNVEHGLKSRYKNGNRHNNNNKLKTQFSLGLSSTNFMKGDNKLCVKPGKGLLLFLLGNHLTIIMINIFKDALLTTRKLHSLMEISVSWISLNGSLIWKSILIFGRFLWIKSTSCI